MTVTTPRVILAGPRLALRVAAMKVREVPKAAVVAVLARVFAFPSRTGMVVGALGAVATPLQVWWLWVVLAATVAAGLQGLWWRWPQGLEPGILRRSLRDPLNPNPRVKSSRIHPHVKSLRLRSRVRRNWPRAMHRAGLSKSVRGGEDAIPVRKRIKVTDMGVTVRVNVSPVGATADDLRAKRRSLESSFRAVDSRVRETGPGWADLELRHTDPLKRKITTFDLPRPTRPGFIVVGLDEDNLGLEKELRLPSLIIGAQGSGKSTEVWTTLRGLLTEGIPFRLRVFDPKGGQEFTDLAPVAHSYERNPLKWGVFLGSALGGLVTRQQELARDGIRNLNRYTVTNPLDLMVIDELVTVAAFKASDVIYHDQDGKHTLKAPEALMLYLSQARSAGYSMLALSQLAQKQILGPAIMDLFGYKTCLRVGSDELVDVVLGPGKSKQYPAHLLPQDEASAGLGYVDTRSRRGVVKYRAAQLSEAERRELIRAIGRMNERIRAARQGKTS